MKLNIRRLKESDWSTLTKWWDKWEEWNAPAKDFLPDNGKGGLIVEKEGEPIVAGFLYMTNSKAVLLEWIISDPDYRENDREDALELLINGCENVCKDMGFNYMFTIGRNNNLIETHKNLGWYVDEKPSHEIVKIIK